VALEYSGQKGRMQAYVGTSGTMKDVAKVTNWSLTVSMTPIETTSLGDEVRDIVPGVRSYAGTCRILYHEKQGSFGVANILESIMRGDDSKPVQNVRFSLAAIPSVSERVELTCDAYITSAAMALGVGEVLAADISFEVIGELTQTVLA